MDKRFRPLPLHEQIALRKKAVDEVLAHPEWDFAQVVKQLRTTMRLTLPEMAKATKVSERTLKDIEAGRSLGTMASAHKILAVAGLRLTVSKSLP